MRVKRGKYGSYQINCANKNTDGNWDNFYMNVNIPKELADYEEFEIEKIKVSILGKDYDAFFSNYKRKDGTLAPKLVVFEKGKKTEGFTGTVTQEELNQNGKLDLQQGDCPWY